MRTTRISTEESARTYVVQDFPRVIKKNIPWFYPRSILSQATNIRIKNNIRLLYDDNVSQFPFHNCSRSLSKLNIVHHSLANPIEQ